MDKAERAFKFLKRKLFCEYLLKLPNLSKPFEVQCDACIDRLGVVLLQDGHPIAYESQRLNNQVKVLGIYKKELLASWKHYLLGTPFVCKKTIKDFVTL